MIDSTEIGNTMTSGYPSSACSVFLQCKAVILTFMCVFWLAGLAMFNGGN